MLTEIHIFNFFQHFPIVSIV